MKRSIRKKYTLRVVGYGGYDMVSEMEISKKEFDSQINSIREQINKPTPEDIDEEDYVRIEENVMHFDYERSTQDSYCFFVASTEVYLTVEECKEGYSFKRGKQC